MVNIGDIIEVKQNKNGIVDRIQTDLTGHYLVFGRLIKKNKEVGKFRFKKVIYEHT